MKRALGVIGVAGSALVAVALTGLIGLVNSAGLIMAPARQAQLDISVDASPPAHEPAKPTVAVVLGNTRTEATDFLVPYAMFAESGAYNVYAVADSHAPRTLAGGVEVVPQLTLEELSSRVGDSADIVLVPAIKDIEADANAPVRDWIRAHGNSRTLLFSWCVGAQVLAASGVIDGRSVTTHWGDIDGLERSYPATSWKRGVRYVDDGNVLTTGGITAGVDATLYLLAKRNGQAVADRVAAAMHYPTSPFVSDPRAEQYHAEATDAATYLHLAFGWPKPTAAIWLYDGVGEVDLAAAVETFGITSTNATETAAASAVVRSRHGLQLLPRAGQDAAAGADRVFVPGGDGAASEAAGIASTASTSGPRVTLLQDGREPSYAFAHDLEELAASSDVLTAQATARQLEVRTPLRLEGLSWPVRCILTAMEAALAGLLIVLGLLRLGTRAGVRAGAPADRPDSSHDAGSAVR